MTTLHHLIQNLTYVSIDRAEARQHWLKMVSCSTVNPLFFSVNRATLVKQKAVAGILSHRQTRGFVIHRLKERALLRRLQANTLFN